MSLSEPLASYSSKPERAGFDKSAKNVIVNKDKEWVKRNPDVQAKGLWR